MLNVCVCDQCSLMALVSVYVKCLWVWPVIINGFVSVYVNACVCASDH